MSIRQEGPPMGIFSGFKRAREQVKTATLTADILGPHVREYFSLPRLAGYSEEWKNKHKADFDARTLAIMQAENPFLALRKEIGDWALWYADYQVLAMTAEHKADSFYSKCPHVSDELQYHLDTCIEHHDQLREYWWNLKDSPMREGVSLQEAVFHNATTYALLGLFYANGFNLMRAVYNDVSVGRDWFRPLILSSLIYAEENYRSKIGLPSLLVDSDTALHHVSFVHLVARGERNPLFVWEDTLRRPHPYHAKAA
jgi:hypothetical protein